jgi:nucleoside-diphosphate-sugar epimerase
MLTEPLPAAIETTESLENLLSLPTEAAVGAMARTPGDVLVLGAGGKMGPSLCRMIVRASQEAGTKRRVIAVSRFQQSDVRQQLDAQGIETVAGDLLSKSFLDELPRLPNVIFMTGTKFGTSTDQSLTWAMNVLLPARVCERFHDSRILAFSTGNVYPFVSPSQGGSRETDPLEPVGEYGMSAVGRERMLEYFSRTQSTLVSIVRLNYAVELRYGVLVDLARRVMQHEPIDLSMGYANVIWQGDANAMALCALADAASPPFVINVAGCEIFEIERVARRFAECFRKSPHFHGAPTGNALINNAQQAYHRYSSPSVSLDQMIHWICQWIVQGKPVWNKPTHFEARDGKF